MDKNYYVNILKARLSPVRYMHTQNVVETAMKMGEKLGINEEMMEKLWLAALLHDFAKDLSGQELLKIAGAHNLIIYKAEEVQPDLLHGPVGAFLCRRDLQIADEEILRAIHFHTTGHERMTLLEKLVFLADLIEPSRNYAGVDELRKICEDDLDKGLLLAFDSTLQYVLRKKMLIHPLTVQARNAHLLSMGGMEH
ncbi:MAG: HD domain-containing protein [Clostridia bacterium]|jgi:predicted HD superfamily hydrolase involved in NAD metabolism|nr:HD domain-containing protein [Clostridia bacterium]